jgi:hypothetical protein
MIDNNNQYLRFVAHLKLTLSCKSYAPQYFTLYPRNNLIKNARALHTYRRNHLHRRLEYFNAIVHYQLLIFFFILASGIS